MYTINNAKKELKTAIRAYLQKDVEGNYILAEVNRLPFYLIGAPGIGKTQLTEQVAEELNLGFVSFSITHHTRNTILGLPLIDTVEQENGEEKYTRYTMSEIIALVEQEKAKGHKEGILLIDEFASMADSLVAPMLAFLQTKNIGNHVLPEGWVMVLCSNPPQYNKTARKFDMAVMDRVRVMEVTFNPEEFLNYAEEKEFHPIVLEYLRNHKSDIHVCNIEDDGRNTIVTTRGWENLSLCLKGYESLAGEVTEDLVRQFIKSDMIAHEFHIFYMVCCSGMKPEQMREVIEGINLSQYINKMAQAPYIKRWNVMNLLSRILVDRCVQYSEKQEFLDYMNNVHKELYKVSEECCEYDVIRILEQRISKFQTNCYYNTVSVSAWEERKPDEREILMLKTIIELCKKEEDTEKMYKEWHDEDERYLKCMGDCIRAEQAELRKGQKRASMWIQNAITFVEGIEQKDSLVEPFINILNQKKEILLILCEYACSNYVKYVRKLYGTDSIASIEKQVAELC